VASELTGAQKAAMLVMSLKEDQAAVLLKHMSDSTLAKLRKAAESLNVAEIGDDQKRQALHGFFVRQRKGGFFLGAPEERFRKVLAKAKGEDGVRQIYAAEEQKKAEAPVRKSAEEFIQSVPDEQMASVLAKQSPRCAAVLLSNMPGDRAGRVLGLLEEGQRQAIVSRIITTEPVPAEVLQEIMAGFRECVEAQGPGGALATEERRAQELARIVGGLDKESQGKMLSQIHERDPELADTIERLMFGFGDLLKVSNKSMQELLRNVEVAQIALALKGAPQQIHDHVYANMSQRAKERVEEEREMAGRVPLSQVENAREEIMKLARKMYREGNLVVEMGGEQYVE
jgi:flagellar motor switch protein FliG